MDQEHEQRLEQRMHRALRELPEIKAPRTLVPRVLAGIQIRASLPWWKQSWAHWPPGARLGFLILTAGVVTALACLPVLFVEGWSLNAGLARVANWLGALEPLWVAINALLGALLKVLQLNVQQALLIGFAFASAMYLACIGIGTACFRVALRRV